MFIFVTIGITDAEMHSLTWRVVVRILIDLGPAGVLLFPQNDFPIITACSQHAAVDRMSPRQLPDWAFMPAKTPSLRFQLIWRMII